MKLFRRGFKKSIQQWIIFLMASGSLLSMFGSCSTDEESAKFIPAESSEIYFNKSLDFDSDGGENTVVFTTNKDWTIDVSQSGGNISWCTVSPMQGKAGTNTVKVSTEANTTYDDRHVTLTFTAEELTQKMVVTQKQKDALTLTTNKYEIGSEGGSIQVEVKANIPYEVQIPEQYQKWIHKTSTRALSTSSLSFTIDKSREYDKREGEIVIKSGELTEILKVYQAGGVILLLTKNEYPVSSDGGQIKVELNSNFEYEVEMPQVDWITTATTRGVSSHTLYYTIAPNTTYDNREADIIYYDKNSDVKDTLKVVQKQKDALTVTTATYEVDGEGGNIEIEVKANITYEAFIPEQYQNWIHKVTSTRGLSPSHLLFTIDKNEEYNKREGEIIIKSGNLSETLKVYQEGTAILFLTEKEYSISSDGGQIKVELNSNFEYEVQMPQVDWITAITTREVSCNTLYYAIAPNTTYDNREAKIIYYDRNSNVADTLTVIQAQKDAIIISQKEYNVPIEGTTIEVELSTNIDCEVSIPEECSGWIIQVTTRGMINRMLQFRVSPNDSDYEREGIIIVKNAVSNDTIKVFQEGIYKTINVSAAGSLPDLIDSSEKFKITHLKLKGELNGTDILFIREMAGVDLYGYNTLGTLASLDLKEVKLVEGGMVYYIDSNSNTYKMRKDLISEYMFADTKLSEIVLPDQLDIIWQYAFKNCINLISIDIPKDVRDVYHNAFSGCSNLKEINANSNSHYFSTNNGALYNLNKSRLYICPKAVTEFSVPDMTTEIYFGAFDDCTNLISVSIPNSVKIIRDAFNNCTALTDVEIPENVQEISGFKGCTSLSSISLPNGLVAIADYTFKGCSSLNKITLPNSVKEIGISSFANCTSLTSINIPDGVKAIESFIFEGCVNLTTVSISNSVTAIKGFAFQNCISLTSINIPSSVTVIENYAFTGSGLISIDLPNSLSFLPQGLFSNCVDLVSISLPKSITKLGGYDFHGCKNLKELYLFQEIPLEVLSDYHTFKDVNKSTCILYVPKGSKEKYSNTDGWKGFSNIIEMK